jgi:hypothetical protein
MKDKQLAELGLKLLSQKTSLNSLWQEISDNFYPERADFTTTRFLGEDFAANISTSFPVMTRRDLGNQFSTMLRPTSRKWYHMKRKFEERGKEKDTEVRQTLEYFDDTMRKAMYDKTALFTRATKEGDHDFATFGQAALSVELNRAGDSLLYRCWHLRDMAWKENADGQIGFVVRDWKPDMMTLAQTFGKDKLHDEWQRKVDKEPFEKGRVLHLVFDAEMYDENAQGRPRWSVFWDADHGQVIESTPIWGKHYILPRWSVVASQYAYSPAVVAALPDARLIQAMTFTLLEVSEKAGNPPLLATKDVVKSDIASFAGGITWVDQDYDERLGDALRPITQDFRGIPFGVEMARDTREMIHRAFYLDTLTLPERTPEMTAYEVGQRIQEYIRNALPIFEPMETEYNAALCDETFELMMRNGAFGSPLDWPRAMQGIEVDFAFESPLHDLIDQENVNKFSQMQGLVAEAIALDPSTQFVVDSRVALRDALEGLGAPAAWMNSKEEVDAAVESNAEQAQQAEMLDQMEQGSKVAQNLSGLEEAV